MSDARPPEGARTAARQGEGTPVNTGPTASLLEQRLRERLAPTRLEVLDESYQHNGHAGANGSGFGTHFRVRIASHLFTGLRPVARHRLVYDALQDFIDQGLHALAIEAEISPNNPSA